MSNFKFSEKEIENLKKEFNYSKVTMLGFYEDLLKLKKDVEKLYDERVFYLGYSLDDAPFHGWEGNSLIEMRNIDKKINEKFKEIYAIILSATGTKIE